MSSQFLPSILASLAVSMAGAGHGGASGRFNAIREGAFNKAWMLSQWGIRK